MAKYSSALSLSFSPPSSARIRRAVVPTALATLRQRDSFVSCQPVGWARNSTLLRAIEIASDIAEPLAVFTGFMASTPCMLMSMRKAQTWVPLGALTQRIAAKLVAMRQAEIQTRGAPVNGAAAETGVKGAPEAGGMNGLGRGAAADREASDGRRSANDNIQFSVVGDRGEAGARTAPRVKGCRPLSHHFDSRGASSAMMRGSASQSENGYSSRNFSNVRSAARIVVWSLLPNALPMEGRLRSGRACLRT